MPAAIPPDKIRLALKLQRERYTQEQIANQLGVHHKSIGRILAKLNAKVFRRLEIDIAAEKAKQIGQLAQLTSELSRAWERSQQNAETTKTTTDENGVRVETTIKGQAGDSGLANQIRGTLADIRDILGLDAPKAVAVAVDDLKPWNDIADGIDADLAAEAKPKAKPRKKKPKRGDPPGNPGNP